MITTTKEYEYISACLKIPITVINWENPKHVKILTHTNWNEISCVVVALQNDTLRADIIKLISNYVPKQPIIDFYCFYKITVPLRHSERVLSNPCTKAFEGLILGISHAEVGLISDLLNVPFANLALSSQDIYYNYKTLQYAIKKYPHKLHNINYIIIDMFRYNYFNYDVSLSNNALEYFILSGIWDDPHHFDQTKYRISEDIVINQRFQGITNEKIDLFEKIFNDIHLIDNYKSFNTYPKLYTRNDVVNDDDVIKYDFNKSIVRKRFEKTINENIEYFKKMLILIHKTWPNAKIMLLHMPLYELALEKSNKLFLPWKKEFLDIITSLKNIVEFTYIDYTNHDISKNKLNWFDFEHLNYNGAINFTLEINKLL